MTSIAAVKDLVSPRAGSVVQGDGGGTLADPTIESKASASPPEGGPLRDRKPCRAVRRRQLHKQRLDERVQSAAVTLWELENGKSFAGTSLPDMPAEEHNFLRSVVGRVGAPPADLRPSGSFEAIQGTTDYAGERCDLAPMVLSSLSLPKTGFVPQPLCNLMPGGAAAVAHVVQSIVVPPEKQVLNQEEIGLEQPYTDPSLKGRKQLSRLIRPLLDRSLVELSLEDGTRIRFLLCGSQMARVRG